MGRTRRDNAERQRRYRAKKKLATNGKRTMSIRIDLVGEQVDSYLESRDRAEYFGKVEEFTTAAFLYGAAFVSNWGSGRINAKKVMIKSSDVDDD